MTSTAGENGGRQTADSDKKARAAQIATQGRHLHGYQGCQEVRQAEEEGVKKAVLPREYAKAVDKYSRRERRTATRRLVLRRELLKDAIYMATKAAKKSGKQKRKESRRLVLPREYAKLLSTAGENGGRQTADGDKKARAAQRATQGRHLHGYQGCRQVQ